MPTASSTDTVIAAARDMVHALQNPSPASALSPFTDSQLAALRQLSDLFASHLQPPSDTAVDNAEGNHTSGLSPSSAQIIQPTLPSVLHSPTTHSDSEPTDSPAASPATGDAPPIIAQTEPRVDTHAQPRVVSYAEVNHNLRQRRRHRKRAAKLAAKAKATVHSPVNTTVLRRSTRRKPVLRFDTNTHTPIFNHLYSPEPGIHRINSAITLSHRKLLQGDEGAAWGHATSLEIGRLAQGLPGKVEGNNTFIFIPHSLKPPHKKATYLRVVCAYKPNKSEPYRVRFTAGGDQIEYFSDVSTPTVDITTVKVHLNSVISTNGARYMTFDLHNFYLNTPLPDYEYMKIPVSALPPDIIAHYHLDVLVENDQVMVQIQKGIYGLPQAGILANALLVERLAKGGYIQSPHTPGLFTHTNGLSFTLWVDDFGVKYINRSDVDDLLNLLRQHYDMEVDWSGKKYLGLTLDWNYDEHYVDLSMPGYIDKLLSSLEHPTPTRAQHSPHSWTAPSFGSGPQYADIQPESTPLKKIIGSLLYYARMVDSTMLVAIGTLASQQSKGTQATMDAIVQLLNYAATHSDAKLRYRASNMILHVTSDASYLSLPEARSRSGGYFYLSTDTASSPPLPDDPPPPFNAAVFVHSAIIKSVMSSAAEAEIGALFYNAKEASMLRNTLTDMGHPQPATPIQTDNACAVGVANDTIKQKRTKAMDMRFYWLRDRVKSGDFLIYWRRGHDNDADYFTKHHPPAVHRVKRARYLHVDSSHSTFSTLPNTLPARVC